MREIKFRAWLENKAMMVNVDVINFLEAHILHIDVNNRIVEPSHLTPMADVHLMQYTGLKDKNGVEIYEGDIVEDNANRYKVIYHMDGFYLHSTYSPDDMLIQLRHSNGLNEVIGNIYENKELLNG